MTSREGPISEDYWYNKKMNRYFTKGFCKTGLQVRHLSGAALLSQTSFGTL